MKREVIPASDEHEANFRAVFQLRSELAGDPYWRAAYEHAAKYKLWPEELLAIGPVLVRRNPDPAPPPTRGER